MTPRRETELNYRMDDVLIDWPTRSMTNFTRHVDFVFDKRGISEQTVWELRGVGYNGLRFKWREVDFVIREAAMKRGVELPDEWFDHVAGGR